MQVSQRLYWSSRHMLLVGLNGKGGGATCDYLAGQQLARGGGLLVLATAPNDSSPDLLEKLAVACGRTDYQFYSPEGGIAEASRAPDT